MHYIVYKKPEEIESPQHKEMIYIYIFLRNDVLMLIILMPSNTMEIFKGPYAYCYFLVVFLYSIFPQLDDHHILF